MPTAQSAVHSVALLSGGDNADKVAIFMRILGGVASPRRVIHCCVPLSEIELSLRDTYALPFSVQDTPRKLDNMIFMDMSSRAQSDNRYAWYHRLKRMNHPAFSASGDPSLFVFRRNSEESDIEESISRIAGG